MRLRVRSAVAVVLGLVSGLGNWMALPAQAAEAGNPAREIAQQFRRGDTALAWQRLDQALAVPPGDTSLRFLKGVMLSETGRAA